MKMMAIGEWIRSHVRESMVYLVMGVLCFYILFAMHMAFWMKLIVVALLAFGTYESIAKIQGKPSPSASLQKAVQDAQKGMDMQMPDLSEGSEGFGPFRRKR